VGTISDPSGAVISGASVAITDTATGSAPTPHDVPKNMGQEFRLRGLLLCRVNCGSMCDRQSLKNLPSKMTEGTEHAQLETWEPPETV